MQTLVCKYRIADKVFEIKSLYKYVHFLCREYRIDANHDYSVDICYSDIVTEYKRHNGDKSVHGQLLNKGDAAYFESLAVYRKIANILISDDVLLFHGSVVAVDGFAYVFTAKSGTGKSTHAKLWCELLGDKAVMVNDDKPLLRIKEDEKVVAYGTPWCGKHNLGHNIAVPVKAVCFLSRSVSNRINAVSASEVCARLVAQAFHPERLKDRMKMLGLLDKLSKNVKLFNLECNMSISAAKLAYERLNIIDDTNKN